ncbi:PREDICTED: uncharacterized protein LOC109169839 [Ipomoea nil]|uniref:uncharacterized protein LOC109169839 n=1 Tax=Ipomoea nil TaxID=35883 RepID=UPI0009008627|nr:PREDICTED: uncharacterized protein LOC109169839 [Ipomoea nil]
MLGEKFTARKVAVNYKYLQQRERWKRPPKNTLKLNVDAALSLDSRTTSAGSIIKDHNGHFVAAMIESDALTVIDSINSHSDWTSFDLVIEDVRQIAKMFLNISFAFARPSANMIVAH